MCAGAKDLTQFVGNGTDVSTRRDTYAEGGEFPVEGFEGKFGDIYAGWLELRHSAGAGYLVSRLAADFLCGDGRRKLIDFSGEARSGIAKLIQRERWLYRGRSRCTFSVVGVG